MRQLICVIINTYDGPEYHPSEKDDHDDKDNHLTHYFTDIGIGVEDIIITTLNKEPLVAVSEEDRKIL